MRIVTWNVNSIRKREEIVLDWLDAHDGLGAMLRAEGL